MDWLETTDAFEDGERLSSEHVAQLLATIACYMMGSRSYETAKDVSLHLLDVTACERRVVELRHEVRR